MEIRLIDDELSLIPYYRNDEVSLAWYQDPDVCRQIDNTDMLYTLEKLHRKYDYFSSHGSCYYISYNGILVGDISLLDNGEIVEVVAKEYQNQSIGSRCLLNIILLAKEKGMKKVHAKIYSFNHQSLKMAAKVGFEKVDDEFYEYEYVIKA